MEVSFFMSTRHPFVEIPHPKEKLLLGNLLELTGGHPIQNMMELAREHGPIYQLEFPGRRLVIVSSYELVRELSDETRFDKKVWRPLQNVRSFGGDGLFTSWTYEPNWRKAHNILLANFGSKALQGYLPMMVDIAEQLVGKWDRLNADDEIDVVGDMTRLTLDTIGLCGFDYRFNSFYREDMHPFVNAMVKALSEAMARGQRLPLEEKLLIHKNRQFQDNVAYMNSVVDHIIKERHASSEDFSQKKDLLSYMLSGIDKVSSEKLDDLNIRYQIITFLIAGHETTSGLLSFAIYELLHHPGVLRKAYEEVDRILGNDLSVLPIYNQVHQLHYITQILEETLRLWPTAPAFSVYPLNDEAIIGGKYRVTKDEDIVVLIPMLHRDKAIWGDDVEVFDPERFSPEEIEKRPADAYKPFGNGQRACIGRQFAMQEAILVMGMILQRYKLIDHTNYQFKIKETLTIKPDAFKIKIKKRTDTDRAVMTAPKVAEIKSEQPKPASIPEVVKHNTPILILFGSNLGTTEDIANRVAEEGDTYGFATTIAPLDDYVRNLPKEGAVIVVTASYNGTPADNAEKFIAWLRSNELQSNSLQGVKYTVFGCGSRDYAATFQSIPRLVDRKLEQSGAQRIYLRGESDDREDPDAQFEAWNQRLWRTLFKELSVPAEFPEEKRTGIAYDVDVLRLSQGHPLVETFHAHTMKVVENRELQCKDGANPSERSTRHLEFEMSADVHYTTGLHLGIIPRNDDVQVERIMRRFQFTPDTYVVLHRNDNRKTNLPLDVPVSVHYLLRTYVELQDVASRKQVRMLADYTQCPPDKKRLQALSGEDDSLYKAEVLEKRKSLIDLLEEFPACEIPFNVFLELLPMLRPRYYSISSSPKVGGQRCSITVSVVDAPARSGHGQYQGVCSNYLRKLQVGDEIEAFVQDTHSGFQLSNDRTIPMIMVGPGTGIAPFRGFLQEQAMYKQQGENIGLSLLFFGCRHPEKDFIYEDELKEPQEQGVVELFTAFSRWEEHPKQYVQDQLRAHKDRVWEIINQGARIYVCGDARTMAPDVQQTFEQLYMEKTGRDQADASQWMTEMITAQRYLVDVWPS
jgi:cytochrome P450 / NADPH-cytochrome P450 reductase